MKHSHLVLALAATLSISAQAQTAEEFSIKGYTLGQKMEGCPAETVTKTTKGAMTTCVMGPTTYAGADAKSLSLVVANSEVITVIVQLTDRGRYAHGTVREALVIKYGNPQLSKSHLNNAAWKRDNLIMAFDGWDGTVGIMDTVKYDAAKKSTAQASTKDM